MILPGFQYSKKLMRKIIIINCCLIMLLSSCNKIAKGLQEEFYDEEESEALPEFNIITSDSLFTLNLPSYMKEMGNLYPDASLQYANIYKDTYTIVIYENKAEFTSIFKDFGDYNDEVDGAENYMDFQKSYITESLKNPKIESYGLSKLNGLPARQVKIFGAMDGIDVAYLSTTLEGENNLFLIMSWTTKERFSTFENTRDYIE